MDFSVLIGGAAGQGLETSAHILEHILKRCGYNVFTYRDYMSRVRGGHNFTQIRFSDRELNSFTNKVDIVLALNEETVLLHKERLKEEGIIICDEDISNGDRTLSFPFRKIIGKIKNPKVINTIGLGVILKYFGIPLDIGEGVFGKLFKGKAYEDNKLALREGYNLIEEKYHLELREDKKIIINGNSALSLGAVAAGCRFYCGYPMTPSTSILSYLSSKSHEMGIMVEQVEDEVAALNMALGASYAGVRAMTGSSGGGFALMVEALSFAGIVEIPVVIVNAQRPGPATGLSTRTEQGDLRFVIHAGHGEFPRMVMALRSPEDAFYQTARAFNLADRYQIPVIILTDLYLDDYTKTIEPFDFGRIKIERHILEEKDIKEYKRYEITESGISPRLIPGKVAGQVVLADSHELDEYGHITEDTHIRTEMALKRMRKLDLLKDDLQEPWLIGVEEPENLVVCWGSTYGAVKEALDRLIEEGHSIGALVFGDIYPLPKKKIMELGRTAKRIIDIEQNMTGQLDSIIREETPYKSDIKILKFDGRPFSGEEVYIKLKNEVLK
ncbi:MAG: 2-oxoacid:acceptor oxidoreductase subunit alpha [Tissierellia bacterium]|nr:2-oxoacid:acceptor oxidoreductase subunit alpha [Tissierellia bacterium]